MKITYNVTGSERKSLVGAISTALNAPTKYLGAPTFAYEVGGYHIDKVGTVVGLDDEELVGRLAAQGVTGEVEYDNLPIHDEEAPKCRDEVPTEEITVTIHTSGAGRTALAFEAPSHEFGEIMNTDDIPALRKLVLRCVGDELPERYAIVEVACFVHNPDNGDKYEMTPIWSSGDSDDALFAEQNAEPDSLTVEFPLDGFSPEAIDNLTKMVAAKEALIKAALGAEELPIRMTAETLQFPWFTQDDPGEAAYYVQFVFALCKTAKKKKRVTAKERGLADNPKYAMRCWLLSLGLIGDEYKNARKLLLARLGGNSSFKGGSRPTYTAHLYTYPNGEEGEAMDCDTAEFTSLAKAKAHCDEFIADCESLMFAGAHVENDGGDYLYEILTDGTVNEK
jgi:hypothetical protein